MEDRLLDCGDGIGSELMEVSGLEGARYPLTGAADMITARVRADELSEEQQEEQSGW